MSQQIEEVFSKYKRVFKGRKEEIKAFLLKHHEQDFLSKKIIKVERIDATYANARFPNWFDENLSSWFNFYRNIRLSCCVVERGGVQKMYHYKFYFIKEKIDEATIGLIYLAIDDAANLVDAFEFDKAKAKIDEMLALMEKKNNELINKKLNENLSAIVEYKEKFEKIMEPISKLEEEIKINKENNKLKHVIDACEKIIVIAKNAIREHARRHSGYKDEKEMRELEVSYLSSSHLEVSNIIRKYSELIEFTKKALDEKNAKERLENVIKQISKLEMEIPNNEKKLFEAIEELNNIRNIAQKHNLTEISNLTNKNIILCNRVIIKKAVLDLGTKFARLQISEISEVCSVKDEQLIIDSVKEMINNKEIYGQYFSSSKSVAFNQQANIDEIDNLMKTYKEWEDKKVEKK